MKAFRFAFALFVSVGLLVGAVGCTDSQQEETAELVFATSNDLTTLDPIKSQEPYTLQVIGQIFEGLVTLNAENKMVPLLAESWTHNEDYTTWRFKIREGVQFHKSAAFGADSTHEMNAEDVRYSFQRLVSKDSYPAFVLAGVIEGVQEYQAGKVDSVAGLRAPGPYTFEIHLKKSEPSFLHRITSPWFSVFPKEVVESGSGEFGRNQAIGTGPFKLIRRSDTEVVLKRNPNYWRQTEGNVERLVFQVIKNEQIRLTELRNGNADITRVPPSLTPSVLPEANDIPVENAVSVENNFQLQAFPTFNSHFIGFNCNRIDKPLRRAISFAIDRREIVDAITHGVGDVSSGTVPDGLLGYQPPFPGDIHSLDSARAALERSNVDPSETNIELLVHNQDNTEQLGALVQAQLQEVGIQVDLQQLDYNTVVSRMVNGETEAFALSLEYVFSAPETILNNVFNSENVPAPNFWRYQNEVVDADLDTLRSVSERERANAIAQRIERRVVKDAPAAFLFQSRNLVMYQDNVEGVAFNGHSIPLLWKAQVER